LQLLEKEKHLALKNKCMFELLTSTLSSEGHLLWVPTKMLNVFLNPLKGSPLVKVAKMASGRWFPAIVVIMNISWIVNTYGKEEWT
jgi:hypothetical protein